MYAEVTFKRRASVAELVEFDSSFAYQIKEQLGREPGPNEQVTLLQLKRVYDFQLEQRQK